MKVAVLGGGPAGAFAAGRFAAAGIRTVLLDEKLAWEKPCGGGLTYKAYNRYPFLIEGQAPKKLVTRTRLAADGAGEVALTLKHPLVIYARRDLNQMLLDRAVAAGAQLEQTRVLGLERECKGWRIRTGHGMISADICILATGARNPLREFGTALTPADTMSALGYYIPGEREEIEIQFLPKLAGYIWIFPRSGHVSAGICGKGEPAAALRKRLDTYLAARGFSLVDATFYSHLLPCLDNASWDRNRTAGDGWLAVGDAAGLVDPLTGEGLYYALRSAELAAETVLRGGSYEIRLRREFTRDLNRASQLATRVFHSPLRLPERMVQLTRRSASFQAVIQDLFAGTQDYLSLKQRLLGNLHGTAFELAMSFLK